MRVLSCWTLALLTGCGACKSTPPAEVAPKDLAEKGLVLDGPEDGATVRGRWLSVSGWFDPTEVAFVSVVGASVDGFYEPTGHVGVPSVAVTVRKDGRFYAPRVPVAEGSNRITVVALSRQMRPLEPIHRNVTASEVTSVPATVVAEPQQGKPGVPVRLRASTGTAAARTWQWDFDGDGTFDEESAEASHAWPNPGRYLVVARTQVDGAWVYGTTRFAVMSDAAVLHSTREVQNPTRLRAFPFEPYEPPRLVAAVDGQSVKIFDADLKLVRTLGGFIEPVDVALDSRGRTTVLDRGANALIRYDASGALDPTYGVNGRLAAPPGALAQTIGLRVGRTTLSVELSDGASYSPHAGVDGGVELGNLNPYGDADGFGEKASCGFSPPFRSPRWNVEGGKICLIGGTQITVSRSGVTFVDYGEGPPIVGDFWALDSTGKLHLFRTGDFEATYSLEYAITAIATAGDGRLYTAGQGVLERRDLPLLRESANQ